MNTPKYKSYIESLKTEHPQLWFSIAAAAHDGLVVIDEESDAITATNRLLLTYPGLHEILSFLNDQWTESTLLENSAFSALLQPLSEKN